MIRSATNNQDVSVILCDCGRTLRDKLDFDKLQEQLSGLEEVTQVNCCSGFCKSAENAKAIKSLVKENKQTKRLVIGACDNGVFEEALTETIKSVGLNRGLLWPVNIREHCAWIAGTKKNATNKAKDILTTAIQRIKFDSPLKQKNVRVNQDVLILGSGLAAMETAVALSQLGHRITLIESSETLGGLVDKMPQLYAYLASNSSDAEMLVRNRADELIQQIRKNRGIHTQLSTELKSLDGELGNFTAVLVSNGSELKVPAGAVVIAADSIHQIELAELTDNTREVPKRIAIVMDVSAEQGVEISSCVLSTAEILANRFKAEVKLYCHNIRVAATGMESLYRRVRQAGVSVIKYDSVPTISKKGSKEFVSVEDTITGIQIDEEFDLVIRTDVYHKKDNIGLLKLIEGLRPGPNEQLQADNVWLNPTQTNLKGLFVIGSSPDTTELRSTQADGLATANKIHELLKDKRIDVLDDAAVVDVDKCVLCLTCMRICPHRAIDIDEENKAARVSIVTCQRCGMCAAECPAGAIQLPRYTDQQIQVEIGNKPNITIFACENSAYPAATAAGINGLQWRQNVQLIRVPCAGKVNPQDVLRALESGAKRVMIVGCHLENCQYLTGSTRATKRLERLNNTLEDAGYEKKRVIMNQLASVEPHKFIEFISENGV